MSKKGAFIGIVVVAAGLSVTPYFIGTQTESAIKDYVALFDESQHLYQARVVSYERDWLSANAVIEVGIDTRALGLEDGATGEVVTTEFELSLQHGPLLTDQGLAIGLASWQVSNDGQGLQDYVQWDSSRLLYLQQGTVNLAGNASYRDSIPQLSNTERTGEVRFELAEYGGQGQYDGKTLRYEGAFSEFNLGVESLQVELQNAQLSGLAEASLQTLLRGQFYEGHGSMTLDAMTVTTAEAGEVMGADKVSMDYVVSISEASATGNELVQMAMDYGFDTLRVNGVETNDLRMNTAMNAIDKGFMDAYLQLLQSDAGTDPEQLQAALEELFEQQGLALLQAEPELTITNFSGSLPEGQFVASASLSVAGVRALPQAMDDDAFWREHMRASTHLNVEKPLLQWATQMYVQMSLVNAGQARELTVEQLQQIAAQQAAMMIQSFVQQGVLREEDGSYVLDLQVAAGVLDMNGQQVPLTQAMGGM
ncbi:DUF945 family protein [Pseudidiomarina terrestris]|uniref:DUF945 family protein n=1 Tax=Pseudidiomarina terrestris TaxID=2820060 RepID=UPI00265227B3|nr:DUF945 family protein [Pseudidiomarina sp. 1ASP75-5]MDN7136107.1 YdgA family protein [Pseudidiomarina sp. 1ASP75-5]